MHDVQNERDARGMAVDSVGITGLRYPVAFDDGITQQSGIADIEVGVRLQHDRRGTHMSRMVELTQSHLQHFDPRRLSIILKAAAHHLDAPAVSMSLSLPFSTLVTGPASGAQALQVHDMTITGQFDSENGLTTEIAVMTDITSLCPCSKAISDYGAHNQRSRVTLTSFGDGDDPYPLGVRSAVEMIRVIGSGPVFPLVKRADERVITMHAFDNPAFVEDMARDLSLACRDRSISHKVHIRNFESIHSHDAFAAVRYP